MPCRVDTSYQDELEAKLFANHHKAVERILEDLIAGKITSQVAATLYKDAKWQTAQAKKKIWENF